MSLARRTRVVVLMNVVVIGAVFIVASPAARLTITVRLDSTVATSIFTPKVNVGASVVGETVPLIKTAPYQHVVIHTNV